MKDRRSCTPPVASAGEASTPRTIAGWVARPIELSVGAGRVRLYTVDALERLVDRDALLRGEGEPPYWAYLWSGARLLAAYVARWEEVRDRRVLEIGCGLGLPGVTAAVQGGRVVLVDTEQAALDFALASATANRVACAAWRGDFTTLDPEWRFDLILAAEVAYDPARFGALAAVFARHLAPAGLGLLADGYRTDTRGFYRELGGLGLTSQAIDVRMVEEEQRVAVRLTAIRKAGVRRGDSRRPPA